MTVAELVKHLLTLPQEAIVVYDRHSDVYEMEIDDVAMAEVIVTRDATGKPRYSNSPSRWIPKYYPHETVIVCNFPGN